MVAPAAGAAVPAEHETGEEHGADDEQDAGDDGHPGGCLIKPIRPVSGDITVEMTVRVFMHRRRNGCACGFLGCGHAPIMVALGP